MNMSQKSTSSISRWLRRVAFVLLIITPLGFAQAQDYEKVEKRLGKMVKKGIINGEQADAMMIALKDSVGNENENRWESKDEEKSISEADMEKMATEIEAAVKSGELTREQARKKFEYLNAKFSGDEKEDPMAGMMRRLKMAVESGRITEQQAEERARAYKTELMKKHYMEAEGKIKAAIEAGKISEEEAEIHRVRLREKMSEAGAEKKDPMAGMKRRLEMAVESGRITEEQAKERAKAYGMQLREKRFEQAAADIRKAVESGKVSREDAEKRLGQMRERMARAQGGAATDGADQQEQEVLNFLGRRLREAVAAGEMTREQAKMMFDAVRSSNEGDDHDHEHGDHDHDHDDHDHTNER